MLAIRVTDRRLLVRLAPLLLGLSLLGGCGGVKIPGVYRLDIQQGNVITPDMLAQLEPGMEKRKVRFILGTPLIADTFNADRWDYVYTFQRSGGAIERRHMVAVFENDRLVRLEGDLEPVARALDERRDLVVTVPDREDRSLIGRLLGGDGGPEEAPSEEALAEERQEALAKEGVEPPSPPATSAEVGVAAAPETNDEDRGIHGLPWQQEPEVIVVDTRPAGSATTPEVSSGGGDTDVRDETEGTEGEQPEELGFLERLRARFGGSEEPDRDEAGDEAAVASEPEAKDTGFFERLSERFGVEPPPSGPGEYGSSPD